MAWKICIMIFPLHVTGPRQAASRFDGFCNFFPSLLPCLCARFRLPAFSFLLLLSQPYTAFYVMLYCKHNDNDNHDNNDDTDNDNCDNDDDDNAL